MNVNVLVNRSHIQGWELRQGMITFTHTIVKALGLPGVRIEFTKGVTTAAMSNSGKMYLSAIKPDAKVPRAMLIKYIGFVVHELLHHKFTSFGAVSNEQNKYILALANALEDIWIERQGIDSKFIPNAESILTDLVNQMVDESLINVTDWADPRQYPFALAIWGRTYAKKVPLAKGLQPIFDEGLRRLESSMGTADNLLIAKWIYSQLNLLEQSPQEEESEGKAKSPGNSEPVKVEPTIDPGNLGAAGHLGDTDFQPPGSHIGEPWLEPVSVVPAKLRYEVRRLFDNTGTTLFDCNRKAGALNTSALHKVGISDRLFKQRRDIDGVDSAVVLALDVSGSMSVNMEELSSAAWTLSQSLNAAGVDVAIVTFESQASLSLPFGQTMNKLKNVVRSIQPLGGTNDYAGLAMAHDLLLAHPAQRKVTFIITDGAGAPNRKASLLEQLAAGERMGITTIGIGIGIDISRTYPKSIRVSGGDLADATFKQIKLAA